MEALAAVLAKDGRADAGPGRPGPSPNACPSSYFERTTPAAAAADLARAADPGGRPARHRADGRGRRPRPGSRDVPAAPVRTPRGGAVQLPARARELRSDRGRSGAPSSRERTGRRAEAPSRRLRTARPSGHGESTLEVDGPRLVAAAQASWRGDAETDSLNRLVLSAGLGWRDVDGVAGLPALPTPGRFDADRSAARRPAGGVSGGDPRPARLLRGQVRPGRRPVPARPWPRPARPSWTAPPPSNGWSRTRCCVTTSP